MNKYYYCVPETMDEDKEEFESTWGLSYKEGIAQDAAEYYYGHSGGEFEEFPIEVLIYDSQDEFIGKFEVEIEYRAEFMAGEITHVRK